LRSQSKFEMEKRETEWQEEKEKLLFEMSVLKSRTATQNYDEDMSTDSEDEAVLRARIEEKDRRIEQLENEVLKGEQIRREMHNTIQELRGNIRVFVRTRPFLPGDNETESTPLYMHPDGENLSIESKTKKHDFKFDKVFAPSSGQHAVFDEVSEFVQSALDGYNVCLFSYGQTGSGKTHTMQGSGSGAMKGIIPRAVEQILNQAKALQKQRWKFTINASFLEIYNEELKDLLVNMDEGVVAKPSGMSTRNQNQNKLVIRREKDGKSYVSGVKEIRIDAEDAESGMQCLKSLMSAAARARSVASTKMNSVSSRSHSVFMLHLHGTNEETGAVVDGALNLCDLAGSERLDRSGAGSDAKRLKETQAINKSLSCLGDVFTALSNGSSHVPFRNSKLTYLLQDCLSGDGKALMFVNLSPTLQSSGESLCSLRFAQRVNQVELGKATKHISYSNSH
jgi:kinesin family protein C1